MNLAASNLEGTASEKDPEKRDVSVADRLLVHWGRWQRSNGVRLEPTAAGQVLGINAAVMRSWDLSVTDDEFTEIDRGVAKLPTRLREIVFTEYAESGSQPQKWRRTGLKREAYGARLGRAFESLGVLIPEIIEKWRYLVK